MATELTSRYCHSLIIILYAMCLVRDYYYERKNCDQKQVNPVIDPTLTRQFNNIEVLAPLPRVTTHVRGHRNRRLSFRIDLGFMLGIGFVHRIYNSPIRLKHAVRINWLYYIYLDSKCGHVWIYFWVNNNCFTSEYKHKFGVNKVLLLASR